MTLLAIVAIHTAANEPPKVRQVMNKIHRNVGLHRRAGAEEVVIVRLRCDEFCSSPGELSEARLRLYG